MACGLESEDSLRRKFEINRTEFTRIRELFAEDSHLVRIAPTFTRLDTDWSWPRKNIGISEQRWEEYRDLFEATGAVDGVELQGDDIFFYMSGIGLGISGSSRGVVFARERPRPIGKSLDDIVSDIVYVELEPQWYLFHWNH